MGKEVREWGRVSLRQGHLAALKDLWVRQLCAILCCCCLVDKLWPMDYCDPMDPTNLLCPWDFPRKNTGVHCHFLLQGIFLTRGSNPPLLHWQADSLPLSHQEAPWSLTKRAQLSSLSSPHHMRMPWESSWLQARKRALTRTQPLLTSWSQTFSPYPCKKRKFCCLSHLIYSILLCQPEQIKSSNQQILTECHWAICQAWGT